jgi:hypothetical protein
MKLGSCLVFIFMACGCVTYRVQYNPAYVPAGSAADGVRIQGKGLLYMDISDENYVWRGSPNSFQGGGTTLILPLGQITKSIAAMRFGRVFSDGCDTANGLDDISRYVTAIQVRAVGFEYRYNRLRNLDFATTPQVHVTIQVNAYDQTRNIIFNKSYDSGMYSGRTALDTWRPAETMNQLAHEATAKLLDNAILDLQGVVRNRVSPVGMQPAAPEIRTDKPAAGAQSASERLKQLKKLYEDGLISKEAYEKKQQEILNSY